MRDESRWQVVIEDEVPDGEHWYFHVADVIEDDKDFFEIQINDEDAKIDISKRISVGELMHVAHMFQSAAMKGFFREYETTVPAELQALEEALRLAYTAIERSTPRVGDIDFNASVLERIRRELDL